MAFHAIRAGEGDAFVAGGVESITQVDGYPKDARLHPKLFGDDALIANVYIPMGLTAENVAERWDVAREDMTATRSARRSAPSPRSRTASSANSRLGTAWRRTTVLAPSRRSRSSRRSSPRSRPGGKVTAGNSCPLNDGARPRSWSRATCARRPA